MKNTKIKLILSVILLISTVSAFSTITTNDWNLGSYSNASSNSSGFLTLKHTNESQIENIIGTTDLNLLYHLNNQSSFRESSSSIFDFIWGSLNGFPVGGAVPKSDGKIYGSYDLPGKSNNYINIQRFIDFGTSNFTISGWVKIDGKPGGTSAKRHPLYNQRAARTGKNKVIVELSVQHSNKKVIFDLKDNAGSNVELSSTGVITLNQWYYLVAVKTETQMFLYIDGILNSTKNQTFAGDFDTGANYNHIGKTRANSANINTFNGRIDEISIWKRALSPSEILSVYKTQKGDYPFVGNYKSKIFDANISKTWNNVTFIYNSTNGFIGLQFRSCDDSLCLGENFTGPDRSTNTFFKTSPVIFNRSIIPNNRYFQYTILINTTNLNKTPFVDNVFINYINLIDETAPTIFNLTSDLNGSKINITWYTNENSNSTIRLGMNISNLLIGSSLNNNVTYHNMLITNLEDGTTYFYYVISCDVSNNCVNSSIFNFTTNVSTEAKGVQAIRDGISDVLTNYTLYNYQKVYSRTYLNDQMFGLFDVVVKKGNKTWGFNYLYYGEENNSLKEINPVLYLKEYQKGNSLQVRQEVRNYINNTK